MANMQQTPVCLDFSNREAVKACLDQIAAESGAKWRDCRRKAYNIYACNVPVGYVFANCLEQPVSYKAIMQKFHKPIISVEEAGKAGAIGFLKENGCYLTQEGTVVLCGTQGEMWTVKHQKLASSYTFADGTAIDPTKLPKGKWVTISRAGQTTATEVGLQIPSKYLVQIRLSWGTLCMNNPASKGHFKGDVIVFPKSPQGGPDYMQECSPINNAVFALTFDQTIGGWGRTNTILAPDKAAANSPTMEKLNQYTAGAVEGSAFKPANPIPEWVTFVEGEALDWAVIDRVLSKMSATEGDSNSLTPSELALAIRRSIPHVWYSFNAPEKVRQSSDIRAFSQCVPDFYRDWLGALATLNAGSPVPPNVKAMFCSLILEAYVYASIKNLTSKEVPSAKGALDVLRYVHTLGLDGSVISSAVDTRIGVFLVDSAVQVQTSGHNVYVTGRVNSQWNDVQGIMQFSEGVPFCVTLILNKVTGAVYVSIMSGKSYESASTNGTLEATITKRAVGITNKPITYGEFMNRFATTFAKREDTKYIVKDSDRFDLITYSAVLNAMTLSYTHLLTNEAQEKVVSAASDLAQMDLQDAKVKYPELLNGGLRIPLTFNVLNGSPSEYIEPGKIKENTRILKVHFDPKTLRLAFKIQFEKKTFEKSYVLSRKNNVCVITLRAYMDMCRELKVHPGKLLFSSTRAWNQWFLPVAEQRLAPELHVGLKCDSTMCKDHYVFVKLNFLTQGDSNKGKLIASRTLRVELNYEHFDINKTNVRVAQEVGANGASSSAVEEMLCDLSVKLAFPKVTPSSEKYKFNYIDFSKVGEAITAILHEEILTIRANAQNGKKTAVTPGAGAQ